MRIQQRPIGNVDATERAEAKASVQRSAQEPSSIDSTVTLSAAAQALDAGDVSRSQYVSKLKAAFERGEGFVNLERVADGLIRDAEENA